MPIDPRIPLMVNAPQIDSPMQMASNLQSIRAAREHSQELQRQRMEDEQIKAIFQQTQGDISKALPLIYQVSPPAAMEIEKRYGAAQKATQELETAKLQHDLALTTYVAQEVAGVTDQRSWDFTRASLEAVTKQQMRPDYDPTYIEGLKQKSVSYKDTLAQKHQAMVDAATAAREERMAADQRADNERQAAAAEQSRKQFETTEARQNREFAVTSGLAARAEARQAKAAGTTGSQENLDAVGAMVIDNPDLLKDFPAKDRGKILTHIATAGGAFPNKRKEKITQLATSALDTIKQMEAHPGFGSAVGAKGLSSAFGLKGAPAEGSAAADFVRLSEALKSQVTLPNLELMKGLGAMSDREFRVVADASSALDRSMSEAGYRAELARLKATLQGLATRTPTPPPPPPPANTTTAPAAKKKDPLGIL